MSRYQYFTLISPNYAPEDTAIGLYNTQMTDFLADQGLKISVITGFPYYPAWEIRSEYLSKPSFYHEKRQAEQQKSNLIDIHRYRQYVPAKPNFLKRILHLCDFTIGSLVNIFKVKQSDIVFCVIPFTSTVLLGLLVSRLRGAHLWVHVQDFEFDAALETGLSKGKSHFLVKLLFKLEAYLLKKADIVSSISGAMCQKITDKTGRLDPYYFPNWIDASAINPETAQKHPLLAPFKDKFTILYSGNIGAKQDWDIFQQLVQKCSDHDHIHFIVVGDGAYRATLQEKMKSFENISFYDPIAYESLGDLLCSADMHILCQKTDVVDIVMPSKILGMFASAKPSMVTGNPASEVASLFKKSEIGFFIDDQDVDKMADYILSCAQGQKDVIKIGQNARQFVTQQFSKETVLKKLWDKIQKLS